MESFQKFQYESFGGSVELAGSAVLVDARLQQNATQSADRHRVGAGGGVPPDAGKLR